MSVSLDNMMSEDQWEELFNVLEMLVDSEGAWKDKAEIIKKKAKELKADETLAEFLSWFESEPSDSEKLTKAIMALEKVQDNPQLAQRFASEALKDIKGE